MPEYFYQNPNNESEIISVIQRMSEAHEYYKDNIKWNRVFSVPQAAIDTKINPLSAKDFAEKTGKKKGTFGDLQDQSKEASEQRKQIMGHDPIKKKYWEDYSNKRGGRKHPESFKD